ncbi:MAG: PA2779 family protein [Gammaproteobacteria bacterium]|nr:PA2779 family protein [Gammaproteobacteria bacterium]
MSLIHKLKRVIALLLVTALIGGQALPLQAAMIGTDTLLQQHQSQLDREQLVGLLERDEVRQQLVALGVDVADASERVAQLTDSEVQQLNGRLAELPAGGDVLGLVVLVFLVFVITDVIGATDIFPFIHPVK